MEALATLEGLDFVRSIRTSRLLYPLLNGSHILSFGLLLGAIAVYDIAVIRRGASAAREVGRSAVPIAIAGLAVAAATGLLLFACRATHYAVNTAFWIKLGLIALAGVNAAAFRARPRKLLAAASLLLWTGTIMAGRWIGFL